VWTGGQAANTVGKSWPQNYIYGAKSGPSMVGKCNGIGTPSVVHQKLVPLVTTHALCYLKIG
jgi:hypothetical protein